MRPSRQCESSFENSTDASRKKIGLLSICSSVGPNLQTMEQHLTRHNGMTGVEQFRSSWNLVQQRPDDLANRPHRSLCPTKDRQSGQPRARKRCGDCHRRTVRAAFQRSRSDRSTNRHRWQCRRRLSLLDQRVVSVQPDPTGVLTIDFEGGDRVVVPVNQSYENWQLLYSDGTMLIGLPGGGITKYPPRPPAGAQE